MGRHEVIVENKERGVTNKNKIKEPSWSQSMTLPGIHAYASGGKAGYHGQI